MAEEQLCKSVCKMYIDDRYRVLNNEQKHLLKWIIDQAGTPMQLIEAFIVFDWIYRREAIYMICD